MHVADRAVADRKFARRRLYRRERLHDAKIKRLGDRKGLHGRAGLKLVGDDAVARTLEDHRRAIVRVVRGRVRKRKDFARFDVGNDHGASERFTFFHLLAERLVGNELHARIDRERHVAPGHGFLGPDVVDDAPEPVADDAARTGCAGQKFVAGELDAFLPPVVPAGVAHNVRHDGAVGIFAKHLGRDADPGNRERANGLCGRHVLLTGEIDEIFLFVLADFVANRCIGHLEHFGKRLKFAARCFLREGRVRPDAANGLR